MAQELFITPLFSDANLVDYYRFEGNSTTAKGTANGTDSNITYSSGNGKFGQGAGFNGSTSAISIGNIYSGSGDFTIHAWIKPASATKQNIFSQGAGSTNNSFFARVNTSNHLEFELFGGAIGGGGVNVADGAFHMIDFVNNSKSMQVYVDGSADSAAFGITSINITASATYPNIGQENSNASVFNGAIDDFGFFNRALTATEISQLFNGFLTGDDSYSYFM